MSRDLADQKFNKILELLIIFRNLETCSTLLESKDSDIHQVLLMY